MSDTVFYMSFADDSGWLGSAYVEGDDLELALTWSHVLGINPGGEVAAVGPVPKSWVKPTHLNVLIKDPEEIENAEKLFTQALVSVRDGLGPSRMHWFLRVVHERATRLGRVPRNLRNLRHQ
jgi:hypothetical protein